MEIFSVKFPLPEEKRKEIILEMMDEEQMALSLFYQNPKYFLNILEKLKIELFDEEKELKEIEDIIGIYKERMKDRWALERLIKDILTSEHLDIGEIIKLKIFSDEEVMADIYEHALEQTKISFEEYYDYELMLMMEDLSEKLVKDSGLTGWVLNEYEYYEESGKFQRTSFRQVFESLESIPVKMIVDIRKDTSKNGSVKMTLEKSRFIITEDNTNINELIALGPSGNPIKIRL